MSNPFTYSDSAIHPEWHTPPELLDRFTDFLSRDGSPVMDYASSIEAYHPGFQSINTPDGIIEFVDEEPITTLASRGDQLMRESNFFLNPPGSREDSRLKYQMFDHLLHRVYWRDGAEMILLVYSINSLPIYAGLTPEDQPRGYHTSVCLVRKRIQFIPSKNNPARGSRALAQNALLYVGQSPKDFQDTFSDLGKVLST